MIVLEDVCVSFGSEAVLSGLSHTFDSPLHFVVGGSGAGKSVLLKVVVGLLRPAGGRVAFSGAERPHLQMVFQHAGLLDAFSVLDNVVLPLRQRLRVTEREALARARDTLESLGCGGLERLSPSVLSPGKKKSVAIARALALRPDIVLYDEPTTGLDPVSARAVDCVIRNAAESGVRAMVVTHDLASVAAIATRVAFLEHGRIGWDGTPAQFFANHPWGKLAER